jgi:histidyl-tRNA synthetase
VIGSDSLLNEYELLKIIDDIFKKLGISTIIKINNRKVLAGIADYIGEADRIIDITVAIDKLDKIGISNVNSELSSKGLSDKSISNLQPFLLLSGDTSGKLDRLSKLLSESPVGMKGITELQTLFAYIENTPLKCDVELDLTLARGLNYYTGAIIEVKSKDVAIGSICGGGRYDNLTGVFGMEGVSGVGISFGADRIYDVLNQMDLLDEIRVSSTEVLIANFGEKEIQYALRIADNLRSLNVRTELYPESAKLKKQLSYAGSKKIPYIIIAGEDEINKNIVTVKIMSSGEQKSVPLKELASFVNNEIKKS